MTTVATKALSVANQSNAAERILAEVGDLSGVTVLGPRILVAVYERSEGDKDVKTSGGIIIPFVKGGTLDEDKFQGKVCLVLKTNSMAFGEGYANGEHADQVKEGDWVVLRPSDGFAMLRGAVTCRLVKDVDVLMKVPAPDTVW